MESETDSARSTSTSTLRSRPSTGRRSRRPIKWRALSYDNLWWFGYTTYYADTQVVVIDRYKPAIPSWSDYYYQTVTCIGRYDPDVTGDPFAANYFATTIVTDTQGDARYLDGFGYWAQSPGVPFWHATVCLNPAPAAGGSNNVGTIAHELGHVLGLDHPEQKGNSCPSNPAYPRSDRRTIMSYNYVEWDYLYPSPDTNGDRGPTAEDLLGPWVCTTTTPPEGGGLAWVYTLGGLSDGRGTYTPTRTPTRTPTPTNTPVPTNTPTPTPTPLVRDHKTDANGDGYSAADEVTLANCGVASCASITTYGTSETKTCKDSGRNCGSPGAPADESVSARVATPPADGYGCDVTLDTVGSLKTTKLAQSDVDLDGVVSVLDNSIVANWFGDAVSANTADPRWEGNFDGDGSISILDLSVIASNFTRSVANNCKVE